MPSVYPKNYQGEAVAGRSLKDFRFQRAVQYANDNLSRAVARRTPSFVHIPMNDNFLTRRAAQRLALSGAFKIAGRAVPYVGWLLTAQDLYRAFRFARDLYRVSKLRTEQEYFSWQYVAPPTGWNGFTPPVDTEGWTCEVPSRSAYNDAFWGCSDGQYLFSKGFDQPSATAQNQNLFAGGWPIVGFSSGMTDFEANMAANGIEWNAGVLTRDAPDYYIWQGAVFQSSVLDWEGNPLLVGLPWYRFHKNSSSVPAVPDFLASEFTSAATSAPFFVAPNADVYEVGLAHTIDPALLPIGKTVPRAEPLPYRLIPRLRVNPWRYEKYQRQSGYQSGPRPLPVDALPLVHPTVVIGTAAAVAARPIPSVHRLEPAMRGDKEKKVRLGGSAALLLNWVGNLTEAADAIDAVYSALPWKLRRRYYLDKNGVYRPMTRIPKNKQDEFRSPQEKLYLIYKFWDYIDGPEMARLLILENIKDMVYGSLGQRLKKSAALNRPHGGLAIGYGAGPAL